MLAGEVLLEGKCVESYKFSSGLTLQNSGAVYIDLSPTECRALYYFGNLILCSLYFSSKLSFIMSFYDVRSWIPYIHSFLIALT